MLVCSVCVLIGQVPMVTQHMEQLSEVVASPDTSTENGISLLEVKVHLLLRSVCTAICMSVFLYFISRFSPLPLSSLPHPPPYLTSPSSLPLPPYLSSPLSPQLSDQSDPADANEDRGTVHQCLSASSQTGGDQNC